MCSLAQANDDAPERLHLIITLHLKGLNRLLSVPIIFWNEEAKPTKRECHAGARTYIPQAAGWDSRKFQISVHFRAPPLIENQVSQYPDNEKDLIATNFSLILV